jgi:hypothetical protein
MNGHIYDVPTSNKADQFNTTTEELVIVIGSSALTVNLFRKPLIVAELTWNHA